MQNITIRVVLVCDLEGFQNHFRVDACFPLTVEMIFYEAGNFFTIYLRWRTTNTKQEMQQLLLVAVYSPHFEHKIDHYLLPTILSRPPFQSSRACDLPCCLLSGCIKLQGLLMEETIMRWRGGEYQQRSKNDVFCHQQEFDETGTFDDLKSKPTVN